MSWHMSGVRIQSGRIIALLGALQHTVWSSIPDIQDRRKGLDLGGWLDLNDVAADAINKKSVKRKREFFLKSYWSCHVKDALADNVSLAFNPLRSHAAGIDHPRASRLCRFPSEGNFACAGGVRSPL